MFSEGIIFNQNSLEYSLIFETDFCLSAAKKKIVIEKNPRQHLKKCINNKT